jgi:hypothetical protein
MLFLAGLLLAALSVALLSQDARNEAPELARAAAVATRSWFRLVAILIALAILVTGFVSGLAIVATLLALLSPAVSLLVVNVVGLAMLWLAVYASVLLYFVPEVIVLHDSGIAAAVWGSLNVVRRNLLSVIGLVVLVNLIQAGLMLIWRQLLASTPSAVIALLANGYVASGLVMATLIFYRDRHARWQETITTKEAV